MNFAKAAPSAPVKKAARENPQILPGGLLILFFLLLAAGEAVQRHHNQHEKADDQQIPVMPMSIMGRVVIQEER